MYVFDIHRLRKDLDEAKVKLSPNPKKPLSMTKLSKKMGISPSTLSRILSGKCYPTFETAIKIFSTLGIQDWEKTYWVAL